MKTIAVCLIAVIALAFGLWPTGQQEDPKAEIKRKRRDARYSDPSEKGRPISLMGNGAIRRSETEFFDPDGYDARTPEEKAAIRERLAVEHAAKRKTVACNSTVILFGQIKEVKGYITTDDTAIYSVYKFIVNKVYRAPQSLQFNAGSEIEITTPGGVARTEDGKTVAVDDSNYFRLTPGMEHILYLKYDEEAGDYYVFDPIGVYKIMPDGRVLRSDAKHKFLARRAHLAKEPNTVEAINAELSSLTCPR